VDSTFCKLCFLFLPADAERKEKKEQEKGRATVCRDRKKKKTVGTKQTKIGAGKLPRSKRHKVRRNIQ